MYVVDICWSLSIRRLAPSYLAEFDTQVSFAAVTYSYAMAWEDQSPRWVRTWTLKKLYQTAPDRAASRQKFRKFPISSLQAPQPFGKSFILETPALPLWVSAPLHSYVTGCLRCRSNVALFACIHDIRNFALLVWLHATAKFHRLSSFYYGFFTDNS